MKVWRWTRTACLTLLVAASGAAWSQSDDQVAKQLEALQWVKEPAAGSIDGKATIKLGDGLGFLGASDTDKFMKLTGNLPRQNSYTLAAPNLGWFAVFDFVPDGYVKDDEKIDADALMRTLKEINKQGEEKRRQQGLSSLVLEDWFIPPRYDTENKRLEWATLLRAGDGTKVVNYSTKLLGRSGHTSAILVSDPATLEADMKAFKAALKGFEYVPGERYSEWKQGDKVAAYGLGALIVGGAAAVATKKGFWAALLGAVGAFWKVIAGAAIAALAWLGSIFKKKA